ncbi:hypothetical protein RIF29_15251 [Crotalaria pallida]|uniref:Uncharacterized protein n=1 Tax=Crotalaria pallida TaxID=3830 RepID=A0AAN9FLG0_CROPI
MYSNLYSHQSLWQWLGNRDGWLPSFFSYINRRIQVSSEKHYCHCNLCCCSRILYGCFPVGRNGELVVQGT